MLYLHHLHHLDHHQQFLQKRSTNPNLFLVGGCVRDVLLGSTKNPLDVDFTMAGRPTELYASFDTTGLSHFITEKFGTITLTLTGGKKTKYELTPLRTEGDYGDFRHPSEIQRSNDLILDSQRRDFTINAMYYFSTPQQTKAPLDFTSAGKPIDEKNLLKILENQGYCYLANLNLLILRNIPYIQQIFNNAKFDETYFRYIVETQREAYFWQDIPLSHQPQKNQNLFRVLIDPTGGLPSLVQRKLETVGEADKRFGEDALRLMRGLRLANVINHTLTHK